MSRTIVGRAPSSARAERAVAGAETRYSLLAAERETDGMTSASTALHALRYSVGRAESLALALRSARTTAQSMMAASRTVRGRCFSGGAFLRGVLRRVLVAIDPLRHSLVAGRYLVYDVTAGYPGTLLGTVAEGGTTLAGVALSDGTHVLEVRTSRHFWEEARCLQRLTVVISGGSSPVVTTLPAISNLAAEAQDGQTVISWDATADGYGVDADGFKLWFAASSPVSTAGTPDALVAWSSGTCSYWYARTQAAAEYVAVAAYDGATTGAATELALPWSTPSSPAGQQAEDDAIPSGDVHA